MLASVSRTSRGPAGTELLTISRRLGLVALVALVSVATGCSPLDRTGDAVQPRPVADALAWALEHRLSASDGAAEDDFGTSVALSGDTTLIGNSSTVEPAGYVFTRAGSSWSEEQKLTAPDLATSAQFGASVAVFDDTALIGAPNDGDFSNSNHGTVHVFARSGSSWSEQQQLNAPGGAGGAAGGAGGESGEGEGTAQEVFGIAVALSGDTAVIGASGYEDSRGAAYVFERTGSTWSLEQRLTADDGAASDFFGCSVAVDGDTIIVGSRYDTVGSNASQGSAYIFERTGATWSQAQKLTADDGATGDSFGAALALSGDRALVGAYGHDSSSGSNQGSAYVFRRNGTTWSQEQTLVASDAAPSDNFGASVALAGDTALVGAPQDDVGTNTYQGSAYVFVHRGTTWSELQKLVAADGAVADHFGRAVAVSEDTALVGAAQDDVDSKVNEGSVYAFHLVGTDGATCSDNRDCASGQCSDDVCCDIDCTGACGACSVAAGADTDGVCKLFEAGFEGSPACTPQACNGVSSRCADCVNDAECPSGTYCAANGRCENQKAQGDACDLSVGADCVQADCRACSTGFCVDGVCCDSACNGACEACSATLTGGDAGSCEPIPGGLDPQAECSDDGAASCEQNGACDGKGACQRYAERDGCTPERCASDDDCTSGHCIDEICCDRECAEGEACRADLKSSGGDGVCGEASTATNGSACTDADGKTCTSHHCVDGVCCDSACDGSCEGCTAALKGGGDDGTCGPVAAGLNPAKSITDDTPDCGQNAACLVPPTCDGKRECGCESGARCVDDTTRETKLGTEDCAPYACSAGSCRTSCNDATQCAPGYRCTADNRCARAQGTTPADDSGCGCRAASGGRSPMGWLTVGWLVALSALGRRRAKGT